MSKPTFAACASAALLLAGTPGYAIDTQPGLWEITTQMNMPSSSVEMPAMTHRTCITREDLVPMDQQQMDNCTLESSETSGNTIEWTMACNQDGMKSQGKGRITYTGASYQGTMKIEMDIPEMGHEVMTQKLSGKRIGDCPQ